MRIVHPTKLLSRGAIGETPEHIGIGGANARVINKVDYLVAALKARPSLNILMSEISGEALGTRHLGQALYHYVSEAVVAENRLENILAARGDHFVDHKRRLGEKVLRIHIVMLGGSLFVNLLAIVENYFFSLLAR